MNRGNHSKIYLIGKRAVIKSPTTRVRVGKGVEK
jgi:hypothetical protein